MSDLREIRREFWTYFISFSNRLTNLFEDRESTGNEWLPVKAGKPGLYYACKVTAYTTSVMLNITRSGKNDELVLLEILKQNQAKIEKEFGESLEFIQGKRGPICRVLREINLGGYENMERWSKISEVTINKLLRLKKALDPYIERLNI